MSFCLKKWILIFFYLRENHLTSQSEKLWLPILSSILYMGCREEPLVCICTQNPTCTHIFLAPASSSYVLMNKYCQCPHGCCVFFFLFFYSNLYDLMWFKHHYIFQVKLTHMLYNAAFGNYCITFTVYQLPPLASTTHTGDCCLFYGVIVSPSSGFS